VSDGARTLLVSRELVEDVSDGEETLPSESLEQEPESPERDQWSPEERSVFKEEENDA
jgi:hypothetical protein